MGTSNFNFKHRCVAVTDEDYERGNVPVLGKYVDYDRCRPSQEIECTEGNFKFFKVVLTAGYYEGGCIDYVETDGTVYEWLYAFGYEADIMTFMNDIIATCYSDITRDEVWEEYGNLVRERPELNGGDLIEEYDRRITERIAKGEEARVNRTIDVIRNSFGYGEYFCAGHFDNGAALYDKVKAAV